MNKSFRSGIAKTTAMSITGICALGIMLLTIGGAIGLQVLFSWILAFPITMIVHVDFPTVQFDQVWIGLFLLGLVSTFLNSGD